MTQAPAYLGVREAAAYTGLSKSYLDSSRVKGNGPPFIKAGGRVLYSRGDLDDWMLARRRFSTSDKGGERDAA